MRQNVRFCKNHPYVRAVTRCYYCKRDICKDCILNLSHHYYCGKKCYILSQLSIAFQNIKTHQFKILWGWIILLSFVLLWILFFGSNDGSRTEKLIEKENISFDDHTIQSYLIYSFKIDSLFNKSKKIRSKILDQKTYDLNIPLQRGWIINVWHNDWPVISRTILKSNDYQFPVNLSYGKNNLRILVWDGRQNIVYGDRLDIVYSNPIVESFRHPVERGDQNHPSISLTFDGGANAVGTNEILDALEKKGIRTTIFLTGQFITRFPELVKRMLKINQEIGNHTFSHPHLTTYATNEKQTTLENVNREFVQKQLLSTDSVFYKLTGQHMAPFWRAPFGEYNQHILDWAAECGYLHIRWTKGFDTFDWVEDKESPIYKSSQQVLKSIVNRDGNDQNLNGAIILMHLGSNRNQDQVYKIVPDLIDELQSRGYVIVPISNLINL